MMLTPSRLLALHTLSSPDQPWSRDDTGLRIAMNPGLGWPLAPFAVFASDLEPTLVQRGWQLVGAGAIGSEDIDGEAWLILGTGPDEATYVTVELDYGDPPEIAVVRAPGDTRPGLVTRSFEPYAFAAPGIEVLRIRGRCRIAAVNAAAPYLDFPTDSTQIVGLPVSPGWPSYHSSPDPWGEAITRVRTGAPQAAGPHENLRLGDPEGEEEARVTALVEPWLHPAIDQLMQRPAGARLTNQELPDPAGSPRPTRADIDEHGTILVAATDPGIARWLGLMENVPRVSGGRWMAITVAAAWALPYENEFSQWAGVGSVDGMNSRLRYAYTEFLEGGTSEYVISDIEALARDVPVLWGGSQAWVDFDAPPDPVARPRASVAAGARWIAGATESDDVAVIDIATTEVYPLGQLGVGVPVQQPIEGLEHRLRPLLSHDGLGFAVASAYPFDPQEFTVYQSDGFGRWSPEGAVLQVPTPVRPALPKPDPVVSAPLAPPLGRDPWLPEFAVEVLVPARTPGQPSITRVAIQGADAPIGGTGLARATVQAGSIPAGGSADASIAVEFGTADPARTSSTVHTTRIHDPRPPLPPPLPPVLNFASRANADGVSIATVTLPAGSSWRVDVALEGDLESASGVAAPAAASRDERAQFWLAQPMSRLTRAFYPATGDVLSAGPFRYPLSGGLDRLAAFRLVPVGANGASADPEQCPMVLFAVPRSVQPPPPALEIDRDGEPRLVVTPRAGGVAADRCRVRVLPTPGSDPRAARVLYDGPIAASLELPLPALPPFAGIVLVAEVRGTAETGAAPSPGLWSALSAELRYVSVPPAPLAAIASVRRVSDTSLDVVLVPATTFDDLKHYTASIHHRVGSDAFTMLRTGLPLDSLAALDTALPQADLAVTLVDPLGRASAAVLVTA